MATKDVDAEVVPPPPGFPSAKIFAFVKINLMNSFSVHTNCECRNDDDVGKPCEIIESDFEKPVCEVTSDFETADGKT